MKYQNIITGKFHSRPNRFIAKIWVEGRLETVHVKNTGRCKELLLPDTKVVLEVANNPNRKTQYDLIAVYKKNFGWVNIDSQAPNLVVKEWLENKNYTYVKSEYTYNTSRLDFYMEQDGQKYLMEVKGCTLEVDGVGYFPDAPTSRGVKHLKELIKATKEGYQCIVAFVIQMEGVVEVRANENTDLEFARTLQEAKDAGVKILGLTCRVTEKELWITEEYWL